MSFISGLLLIDAPASALNNSGQPIPGAITDNSSATKFIKTKEGNFAYVSAQAFRFWLRTTLEANGNGWKSAPVYREEKVAYTDANPIRWWDDDLFGYMRAPSKKASAAKARESDITRAGETPTSETVTRVSPFRVSTLVSISPVSLVNDWGVMARHEGDPVPYEHQFYRTTLMGLFSLDLNAAGTFYYRDKTGYLNLDEERKKEAQNAGLEDIHSIKAYRLKHQDRLQRIAKMFEGMARLDGGAKQAQHYTDVSPDIFVAAVVKGGNNIFGHIIGSSAKGTPEFKIEALLQALSVNNDQLLSKVFIGWVEGYLDDEKIKLREALSGKSSLSSFANRILIDHPVKAVGELVNALKANPG
ncbi:type I-B CRISPR-associated protein Cas7/Cst2/DevR, partial [bacterium]|nr:type I-B CRISPR-associated protein Cas7/Cst2/DevR [bacterium]